MKTSALVTLLLSTSTVTTLLADAKGGGKAVYEQMLPRAYKLPAIAVHRYGGVSEQTFGGPINLREDNLQIDCYGDTAADCDAVTDACRTLLNGFAGTLAGGTVVVGTFLEQDRDMPFLPNADVSSMAFRSLLGFRIVSQV